MAKPSNKSTCRREYLVALGTSVGAIGLTGLAGCTEINSQNTKPPDGDGEATGDGPSNNSQINSASASDIRVGDTEQRLTISMLQVYPGTSFELLIDVSELTKADIGTGDLGAVVSIERAVGWTVTDATISNEENRTLRVSVSIENEEHADEQGYVEVNLTNLQTDEAKHVSGLQHSVTLESTEDGSDSEDQSSATYNVIDPDELENVLRVTPRDIRAGESEQQIRLIIEHATDDIGFRMDISPLTDVDVEVGSATVTVEDKAGERRGEEETVEVEIADATIESQIVRVDITTSADTVAMELQLTGLDTDDAEPSDEITYPIYTGERPSEPSESRPFSISGVVA